MIACLYSHSAAFPFTSVEKATDFFSVLWELTWKGFIISNYLGIIFLRNKFTSKNLNPCPVSGSNSIYNDSWFVYRPKQDGNWSTFPLYQLLWERQLCPFCEKGKHRHLAQKTLYLSATVLQIQISLEALSINIPTAFLLSLGNNTDKATEKKLYCKFLFFFINFSPLWNKAQIAALSDYNIHGKISEPDTKMPNTIIQQQECFISLLWNLKLPRKLLNSSKISQP